MSYLVFIMSPVSTLALSAFFSTLISATSRNFPADFKFGTSTAAYQIEGAWNLDGKGESIWDRYVHTKSKEVVNGSTGDVAADSYHHWREDVNLVAQLGLDFYRFSISWPRILPTGLPNKINKAGVKYYSDLIDALIARGIEPVVTLYHWDLPVKLQDLGGWTNPLIADWFEDYSRVIFSFYADRVKTWLTINEAIVVCDFNYNLGRYAPGIQESEIAPFLCNKNILLAHARAYRLYEREYKEKYNGKISLANNVLWIEPKEVPRDSFLAELGLEHMVGRYSHPIYSKKGGWPHSLEKHIRAYSLKQGYNTSCLPAFTEKEKKLIKGTADFYGLNYYTTRVIRPAQAGERGTWFVDGSPEINAMLEVPPDAKIGVSPLIANYPKGIRKMLSYLKSTYGDIEFLITENGYPDRGEIEDYERVKFLKDHLEQVYLAINVDNVKVTGYSYWSLIDTFEWLDGYSTTFGLFDVDFKDPKRHRYPRLSAFYYECIVNSNSLDVPDECVSTEALTHYNKNKLANNSEYLRVNYVLLILSLILILN
ncbi:myrosinase 1-like isoform X2 [Leptidea sinapis]|uniref:myrosinase 1-like isoform X2 n=1 Tax=Leptidea sinapis TaxID=189913 RepID=UPI002121EB18|nr:myrosinase 1-like isoform X2 [Leptidea sinapis]